MSEKCETCRFWAVTTVGRCHRYPPDVVLTDRGLWTSRWRQTLEVDWCGEWAAKQQQGRAGLQAPVFGFSDPMDPAQR